MGDNNEPSSGGAHSKALKEKEKEPVEAFLKEIHKSHHESLPPDIIDKMPTKEEMEQNARDKALMEELHLLPHEPSSGSVPPNIIWKMPTKEEMEQNARDKALLEELHMLPHGPSPLPHFQDVIVPGHSHDVYDKPNHGLDNIAAKGRGQFRTP